MKAGREDTGIKSIEKPEIEFQAVMLRHELEQGTSPLRGSICSSVKQGCQEKSPHRASGKANDAVHTQVLIQCQQLVAAVILTPILQMRTLRPEKKQGKEGSPTPAL